MVFAGTDAHSIYIGRYAGRTAGDEFGQHHCTESGLQELLGDEGVQQDILQSLLQELRYQRVEEFLRMLVCMLEQTNILQKVRGCTAAFSSDAVAFGGWHSHKHSCAARNHSDLCQSEP